MKNIHPYGMATLKKHLHLQALTFLFFTFIPIDLIFAIIRDSHNKALLDAVQFKGVQYNH